MKRSSVETQESQASDGQATAGPGPVVRRLLARDPPWTEPGGIARGPRVAWIWGPRPSLARCPSGAARAARRDTAHDRASDE